MPKQSIKRRNFKKTTYKKKTRSLIPHIAPELKYVYLFNTPLNFLNSGSLSQIQLLSGVQQGTGPSFRIGSNIYIKYIDIKWYFSGPGNGSNENCRILVIRDKRNNGGTVSPSEIVNSGVLGGADYNSVYNTLLGEDRFEILFDYAHGVEVSTALNGGVNVSHTPDLKMGCKVMVNKKERFSTAFDSVNDVEEGAIFLLTLGLKATAAGCMQLVFSSACHFIDL